MNVSSTPVSVCPQCGARFRCGMEAGDTECWCASQPLLPLPLPLVVAAGEQAASCFCPDCLEARRAEASTLKPA